MLVTNSSKPTWLQIGLQTENQLTGLHVEEADLPVCERCDQMSWITAHQIYRGGNSQLWYRKNTNKLFYLLS